MGDSQKYDAYLKSFYYNPKAPGSFSSYTKLWGGVKNDPAKPKDLQLADVKNWLTLQDTHLVHARPPSHFKTQRTVVEYIDMEWQTDIIVMTSLAKQNRPFKYILVIIDVFRRFLFTRPLKTKTATETAKLFQEVIDVNGKAPEQVSSDQGGEYRGRPFQEMLKTNHISHFLCYGPHHASICERVNQTIEHRLYKYFTENATTRFVDILQDITYSINNTVHSTLKRTPASINEDNEAQVYHDVYEKFVIQAAQQPLNYKFKIGDLVRISTVRSPFHQGYKTMWTEEIFSVSNLIPSRPERYRLKDLLQHEILGSFYQEELQRSTADTTESVKYVIDRVISYKTVRGVKFAKVRWYGVPQKFDTYIKKTDLKNYKRVKR